MACPYCSLSPTPSDPRAAPLADVVQFDDQETIEHSRWKPLSIPLAVVGKERRILGFEVASMPPKGKLAQIASKKYGYRKDERRFARQKLFNKIAPLLKADAVFESDQNPHYPGRREAPSADRYSRHTHKSRREAAHGQGELKKGGFDPLFSVNHTFAMTRANINRLVRKTWCTTKRADQLLAHIYLYAEFHNSELLNK